MLQYTKTWVN